MNDTTAVTRKEHPSRTDAATRNESAQRSDAALMPPVDVIEDSTGITLRADLPGVPKDKLKLQVESGTLTIEGEVSIPMSKVRAARRRSAWRRGRERRKIVLRMSTLSATQRGPKRGVKE